MKRRKFIALLGGAARRLAAGGARQPAKLPTVQDCLAEMGRMRIASLELDECKNGSGAGIAGKIIQLL